MNFEKKKKKKKKESKTIFIHFIEYNSYWDTIAFNISL